MFAFCLESSEAPSGRELMVLYPGSTGQKEGVLVLPGRSAGEMVLTWSRGDLALYLGKAAHGLCWSHVLPVPGDGGLDVVPRTRRAAVCDGRFWPLTCVGRGFGFGGIVSQVT